MAQARSSDGKLPLQLLELGRERLPVPMGCCWSRWKVGVGVGAGSSGNRWDWHWHGKHGHRERPWGEESLRDIHGDSGVELALAPLTATCQCQSQCQSGVSGGSTGCMGVRIGQSAARR